jgi:outer membrane protein
MRRKEMKLFSKIITGILAAILLIAAPTAAANVQAPKIGLVNFKTCVEESKMGKQEQANFEKMKKQMEDVLAEKEKTLKEISAKMGDEDYLDSLSEQAQAELKHKFRSLNQELGQHQQQFFQVLQQANFKIIQKMNEEISEAAKIVAKNKSLDIIINEEGTFYVNPSLDISSEVIAVLDERFKKDEKK